MLDAESVKAIQARALIVHLAGNEQSAVQAVRVSKRADDRSENVELGEIRNFKDNEAAAHGIHCQLYRAPDQICATTRFSPVVFEARSPALSTPMILSQSF